MPKPISIKISIPEPCAEPWDKMKPDSCGKFCLSCQKTVIDFTALSDNELVNIITNTPGAICGRFQVSQLNRDIIAIVPPSNKAVLPFTGKIAASFLLLQTFITGAFAQRTTAPSTEQLSPVLTAQKGTVILNGAVIDNNTQLPLVGMEVSIDGLNYVKYSDAKGRFQFVLPETFKGKTIYVNATYTKNGSTEIPETQIRTLAIEIPKHEKEITIQLIRYPLKKMEQIVINSPLPLITITGHSYSSGEAITSINEPKKHGLINWIKNLFSKKK